MSDEFAFGVGSPMSYHGHECTYRGVAANGRCQIADDKGWILEVPDEDGFPVYSAT